jgi:release factor glutamine methyltransferase
VTETATGGVAWQTLLDEGADQLARAGIDNAEQEARWLVQRASGLEGADLIVGLEEPAGLGDASFFYDMLERRLRGEPLQYVLGRWGFRVLDLQVDNRVLIPRPETEALTQMALEECRRLDARLAVDLGTGSGAIALALLDERPDLHVTASEVSPEAADVARANAARLGLALEVEVADGLPPGDYDLVIANLPYVRDDRWEGLQPEITRYEPRVALTSGADGLDAIRELVAALPSGTRVALEHADDQADAVRELLDDAVSYPDLASWDRITVGRAP